MNTLLEAVKNIIGTALKPQGFSPQGRDGFVRKSDPHKREEYITLYSRKGRAPLQDQIHIYGVNGITYKSVNSLDKKVEIDFLNPYPLIAGPIGQFKESGSAYMSIPIGNAAQVEETARIIERNLTEGSFNLFSKYPTLESILVGIEKKEPWLENYHQRVDLRHLMRLAAITCLVRGKAEAIDWFEKSTEGPDGAREAALKKMRKNW
jgi:hypothetical protein